MMFPLSFWGFSKSLRPWLITRKGWAILCGGVLQLAGRAFFVLGVSHGRYAQNARRGQRNMSFYCQSSRRSASLPNPETFPVISPVAAKKTGLLRASANIGTTVSVNVRTPEASLKRPVPPVI